MGFKKSRRDHERTHSERHKSSFSPTVRRKRGLSRTKSFLNKKFRDQRKKKKMVTKIRKSSSAPTTTTKLSHSPGTKSNRKRHLNRIKSGVLRGHKQKYHYHDDHLSNNWRVGQAPGLILEILIDSEHIDLEPTAQTFHSILKAHQDSAYFFCIDDMKKNQSHIFCTVDAKTKHEWVSTLMTFCSSSSSDGSPSVSARTTPL